MDPRHDPRGKTFLYLGSFFVRFVRFPAGFLACASPGLDVATGAALLTLAERAALTAGLLFICHARRPC